MPLAQASPLFAEPIQQLADILIRQAVVRTADKDYRVVESYALLKKLSFRAAADPCVVRLREDNRLGLVPYSMNMPNKTFTFFGQGLGDGPRIEPGVRAIAPRCARRSSS